jgi:hypothetical protein
MNKLNKSADYFTYAGAKALAHYINAYWSLRGLHAHAHEFRIDPKVGECYYVVRSAMVGGQPT